MTETTMAQGIEARVETAPVAGSGVSAHARFAASWAWVGVACVVLAASVFLFHQLMAWPPHEDETLALLVGRDSLSGVVDHVTRDRGGAPLHFLLAWAVAHLGFGLGGLRTVSALLALASLPLVALLATRLAGRRVAVVATALVAPSWLFLFHGVYGRMYSLFLFCSLVSTLALVEALRHGGRRRWALWVAASLLMVAAHPYGVLLLAGQAVFVLVEGRHRLREAFAAGAAVLVLGVPFWLTDLVLVDRFEVGVGGGGEKLGGPGAVARYLFRSAGDATAGWWPVTLAVVLAAAAGIVVLRRTARVLVVSTVAVTALAFVVAKLGGSAAPESRHLIYLAPFLAIAVAASIVRLGRRVPALGVASVVALIALEVAWAWHRTPPLFEWEPDARQAARAEAEAFLATTSRPDDVLFGYEPLYLGAWERNHAFPRTVVPRADARLAVRTVEDAPALGRGVWILDASERNNVKRALEIERRLPTPSVPYEARVFGPFLVLRTVQPVATPRAFFYYAARALLVGQALGIGDADINVQTAVQATRELRGYGPSLRSRSSSSR
jgi:hypothetical protein